MDPIATIAMAAGLSWASGIRLYLTVLVVGLLGKFAFIPLPSGLDVLTNPYVLGVAGVLVLVEFVADKIPWVDSLWDTVHTFIRIPAGAMLAMGAIGADNTAMMTIVALLGGSLTGATHLTKASTRALVNTSPEPVSNVVTSLGEDALVIGGGALALFAPVVFLVLLGVFIIAVAIAAPRLYRLVKHRKT